MTDILDTARKYVRDADAREYAERDISPTSAQTYAICRALIARTEALRELTVARDEHNANLERVETTTEQFAASRDRMLSAWEAARKALAEKP